MVAEEIRFLPLESPFTMCRLNGDTIHDGAVNVVVYSLGSPVVLVYVCGPKTGVFAVTWAPAPGTDTITQRQQTARNSGSLLPRLKSKDHDAGFLIVLSWPYFLTVSMPFAVPRVN